jgi:phospholipase B1
VPATQREADSAHLLTPADIGIVAAIGDSITAAFGARGTTLLDFFWEARGVSWSIGGDEDNYEQCTTIPNILRYFNPNLKGASYGYGGPRSSGANLNRAVSGAKSDGICSQAKDLVERIQAMSAEDQEKWKLVTIWIGGNDLCQKCNNTSGPVTPAEYVQNIVDTILYLKQHLKKTLVSVPVILDVTKLAETTGLVCGAVHLFACKCSEKKNVEETSQRAKEYVEKLENVDLDSLNDRNDFGVVVQPFFKDLYVPVDGNGDVDMSFFAPDCFHMSTRGHRAIAAALWNNMITDKKENTWNPYDPALNCPKDLYIYTSRTRAMLDARAQGEGGFNSQSLPNEQTEDGEEGDGEWSLGQIFGVTIGTAAVGYLVVVVVVGVVGGVVWVRRRQRAHLNGDAIPLVKRK